MTDCDLVSNQPANGIALGTKVIWALASSTLRISTPVPVSTGGPCRITAAAQGTGFVAAGDGDSVGVVDHVDVVVVDAGGAGGDTGSPGAAPALALGPGWVRIEVGEVVRRQRVFGRVDVAAQDVAARRADGRHGPRAVGRDWAGKPEASIIFWTRNLKAEFDIGQSAFYLTRR